MYTPLRSRILVLFPAVLAGLIAGDIARSVWHDPVLPVLISAAVIVAADLVFEAAVRRLGIAPGE